MIGRVLVGNPLRKSKGGWGLGWGQTMRKSSATLNSPHRASHSQFRVPQKEVGKRSSITFFRFRDSFGHFSVTFSDAFVTFFVTFLPDSFCRTPFASG